MFFILVIVFVMILGVGLYLSHSISAPIKMLMAATHEISRGNLNANLDIVSKDEIGALAASFNRMIKDLKETTLSKNYVDNILQSMTDYLIIVDVEGKISNVNKSFFDHLGYSKEELTGSNMSCLFFEGERYFNSSKIEEYMQKAPLINFKTVLYGKTGVKVPALLSSAVIREIECPTGYPENDCQDFIKSGKHCEKNKGVVFLVKDITDLKKAESELQKSNIELTTSLEMSELLLKDLEKEKQTVMDAQKDIIKINQELIANEKVLNNMMSDMIKTNEELKNVREIRNDSIGHPTKRDGGKSYHFISRITISKDGFQLMSWNKNKNIVFKDIVIVDLLNAQSRNITVILKDVIKKLKDEDKKHKEKFCMDKLKDVFSQVHYDIQKVHEGLSKPKYIPISKISLQMINECLTKFENKLNERGISLDTYDSIKDIYVLLKYPLFELSRFFLKTKKNIKMNIDKETAFIFWYFVREHIEKLEELAKEIDEEYIK